MPWQPCCCVTDTVECAACSTGFGPMQFQVDVSGVVDRDCSTCETFDGTYIADYYGNVLGACEWRAPLSTCTYTDLKVRIFNSGADTHIVVIFSKTTAPTNENNQFRKVYTSSEPNCETLSGVVIPFWFENLGTTDCGATSAAVTLTAL